MTKYIIRRFLSIFPTIFIIITISFFLIRLAPGGPFAGDKALPPTVLANIEKKYHMDEPLMMQYARYVFDVLRGDFGPSYRYYDHDVNYFIFNNLPRSMMLGVIALSMALLFGVSAGIMAAIKQNRWPDYVAMSFAVTGISVPLFVIGPVMVYFLSLKLRLLPTSGWIDDPGGWLTVIMPAITLSLPFFAVIARLTRASILEVLRSDYVRTARAKGLSEGKIMVKHVLKGAMIPIVSYLGPAISGIIVGSVIVETIFLVPGTGKIFVESALNRDYTLIMGSVIVYGALLLIMNFLVDIFYSLLDPRVAYK